MAFCLGSPFKGGRDVFSLLSLRFSALWNAYNHASSSDLETRMLDYNASWKKVCMFDLSFTTI